MEEMLDKIIEAVWANYDSEGLGKVGQDKLYEVFEVTMEQLGEKEITKEQFNGGYEQFKKDEEGRVERDQVKYLFKEIIDSSKQ